MVHQVRKAFTLIEILIVVIILGILAAIVVPQFTSATEDAQLSSAKSTLQTVRSQIELYRVRNNGAYPAFPFAATALSPGGWGDGVGANNGFIGNDYMRSEPMNPRTGTSTVVAGTRVASIVFAASGDAGWFWDGALNEIYCNGLDEALDLWTPAP